MTDLMQVARARCDDLRRETRELEEFIRFGEGLIEGEPSSRAGQIENLKSSPASDGDVPSGDRAVGGR